MTTLPTTKMIQTDFLKSNFFLFKRFTCHKGALIFIFLLSSVLNSFAQYDVVLGTDNVPISSITLTRNGITTTQTSGNQSTIHTTDFVRLDSIVVIEGGSTKVLKHFDVGGAKVSNNNFSTSVTGVGVYDEGIEYLASNQSAWESAMEEVVADNNILHYLFYDNSSNIPSGFDFDLRFARSLTNNEYIVVSERDGNTYFTITPIGVNGLPISGARSLRFGFQTGNTSSNGNNKYDWNTRYASTGRQEGQPQYMSVVSVALFNTNQNIYGLRIDNTGDADVKFYAVSDSTFIYNTSNPLVAGVSGNIFNDQNGLIDAQVDGTLIDSAGNNLLYVSLVQGSNIIETVSVDTNGHYFFPKTAAGTYSVVLHTNSSGSIIPSLPSGWINTGENDGAGVGSDGLVNGISPSITVTDSLETQLNFGITQAVISFGDKVWMDANGNGIQDIGEQPIPGVEIWLYDNSGNPVTYGYDTITTPSSIEDVRTDFTSASDNDGSINFNGGWNFAVTGSGSGALSAYDEIKNNELSISGLDGVATRNITPPSISIDTVTVSFSLKQVGFDPGDNGIVEYYNGSSWVNLGTITNSELPISGSYYDFTFSSTNIPGLLDIEGIRFSEGSWSSSDEGFYIDDLQIEFKSAVQVTITPSNEQVKDTTDENGNYSFSSLDYPILASEQYEMRIPSNQSELTGLSLTSTGVGSADTDNNGVIGGGGTYTTSGIFTSPSVSTLTNDSLDFGFVGYSIGNSIWWDNDNDGIRDDSEIGVSGVNISLLNSSGTEIATTTSDASGKYIFNGLFPGTYQVAVTSPLGSGTLAGATVSSVTNTTADIDNNNDGSATDPILAANTPSFSSISNAIVLGGNSEPTNESDEDPGTFVPDNQSNLTIDFGFVPPTTALGNAVFWDKNNDGDFDLGTDEGLEGVKIYLYQDTNGDQTANFKLDSTTTDAQGNYSFVNIGAGTFKMVIAPENFLSSGKLSSGTPTTNSNSGDEFTDGNSEGNETSTFALVPNAQPTADAGDASAPGYEDNDANFTFDFGFYGFNGGPVPVELISFSAIKLGERDALLNWETASELNNDRFEVYKSLDYKSYVKIGEVSGAGMSNEVLNYSFIDQEAATDKYVCYKLKQVDFDGTFEWSSASCIVWNNKNKLTLYPNPARDVVNVHIPKESGFVQVELLNTSGETIHSEEVQGKYLVKMSTSGLSDGVYFIRVKSRDKINTQRIFIAN